MQSTEAKQNTPLEGVDRSGAEWVYSMSAPHEEGQPDLQFIIGKPLNHADNHIFMLPVQPEDKYKIWDMDVPVNIIVDGQIIESTAKGQIANKKFKLLALVPDPNTCPKGVDENVLVNALERQMRAGESVFDALIREIERQCLEYFDTQILGDRSSTRDEIDRVVNG